MSGAPPSEQHLLARARAGDPRAYEDLVRRHQQRAFRTALVLTGSASDAEDVVQEAFLRGWAALDRFREGSSFAPWLLTIVARQAGTQRRAAGRRRARTERAALDERWAPAAAPEPTSAAVLEREQRATLIAALGRLSGEHRMVIELRHLVGLSEQETAAALGCRPGTVKSRLSRALAALRADLGQAP